MSPAARSGNSTTCRSHSCTRRVARTNPTWPYCVYHDHENSVSGFNLALMDERPDLVPPMPRPVGTFDIGDPKELTDLYGQYTHARKDVLEPMIRGALSWRETVDYDLSVPANCLEHADESVVQLRDHMREAGVPINRISCLRLTGMNRKYFARDKRDDSIREFTQNDPDAWVDVVAIDHGTPEPVIVDPNIAIYAPTPTLESSCHDHFASGETPFTEELWIGNQDEYLDNSRIWWNDHRVVLWHQRGV